MLKTAREVIASKNVPQIVDFGIETDRQIKADGRELETVKECLREIGKTSLVDRRSEKTVEIQGNLGVVSVTYPADGPKLKKGVDLLASEQGIHPGIFAVLFRKKTVVDFASDFLAKLRKFSREDQEMILGLVEIAPHTARVNWPK